MLYSNEWIDKNIEQEENTIKIINIYNLSC